MDKKEFATIAAVLKQAYGAERILPNQETMDIWYGFLKDFEYSVMKTAVTEHIATNRFPPAISELRELAVNITTEMPASWDVAWGKVLKAVRTFGHYQEIEALRSLDGITAAIVKRMGFQNICLSESIEVERANFRMAYENELKCRRQDNLLPGSVRREKQMLAEQSIAKLADKLGYKEKEVRIDGGE